jgi:hypothetical protein
MMSEIEMLRQSRHRRSLHPVNAFEFNELNIGVNVSPRRGIPQVLRKRTAFNPVAVLVDCTDYSFLHVRKFVQLEPDELVDVTAELDSLAGNKIGNVWHLVVLSVSEILRQLRQLPSSRRLESVPVCRRF